MPPMPTDLDIYRSAKLLIDRHGQDALIEAADWKKRICASIRPGSSRRWPSPDSVAQLMFCQLPSGWRQARP